MAANPIKAWKCLSCGRIDDPRPCVGDCRHEQEEFVLAAEHDAEVAALRKLALRIASATPRAGEWEDAYRKLQCAARKLLSPRGRPRGDG